MRIQNKKNKVLPLLISLGVLAIAIYLVTAYYSGIWPFPSRAQAPSDTTTPSINYNKPTDQEVASSQDGKKNSGQNQNTTTETDTNKTAVSVEISYSAKTNDEKLEIRAFTPDVIEGDGTCTAVLTKDGAATVTYSSPAFIDATSSICEPMYIPISEFSAGGAWTLVVNYASDKSEGSSDSTRVDI